MATTTREITPGLVLLLEPNAALRSAILTILAAERYQVKTCESLERVLAEADGSEDTVALVAWQSMNGLLAEEHRHHLAQLTQRVRFVAMVPRRWARLLEATDLAESVAGLVAKPFEAEELIDSLNSAFALSVPAG